MLTMKQVSAYLKGHGIPPSMVNEIRLALTNDAVQQSVSVQSDRIFTIVALTLREAYGFGYKRIFEGLKKFDELNQQAADDYIWPELMERLRDETGIVVKSGDDQRIAFEYKPKGGSDAER